MAVRYGRYEVLYKLGQGAMAQVFLAKDPVLSRFVAIKVLHADLAARKDVLQRFFNEARTVAAIRSPHVVEVFDFGQEGRDLYLVMEFVDGMSLHGLLRHAAPRASGEVFPAGNLPGRGGHSPDEPVPLQYEPLRADVAAALICQAAEGLTLAAAHGVVHRDLKPENLMLNTRGYLKISDFGIAHVQDESLTKTGAVLGSPLYMSPEQAQGLKPITSQSDMFSLGAVFYASLAGYPPFRGRTVTELFRKISAEPHMSLQRLRPDLDPDLSRLVDVLLSKRPEERGGGPQWLHRRLQAYLLSRGAADPAILAADYLRELGDRGVHTTWKADGRNDTLPMTLAHTQPATVSVSDFSNAPPVHGATVHPREGGPAAPIPVPTWGRTGSQGRRKGRFTSPLALSLGLAALGISAGLAAWGWAAFTTVRDSRALPDAKTALAGDDAAVSAGRRFRDGKGPDVTGGGDGRGGASGSGVYGNMNVTEAGTGAGGAPGADESSAAPNTGAENSGRPVGNVSGKSGVAPEPVAGSTNGVETANLAIGSSGDNGAVAGVGEKVPESILVLKSSPPFSEAYLDGQFVGTTPVRIGPLAPGRHRLAMKSARLPGLDTSVNVEPGIHALKVHLEGGAGMRVAATTVDGD